MTPRSAAICVRQTLWRSAAWCWRRSLRVASSEFEARRESIAAGLAERKLDALLVAFSPNLRYLSGFTGSNGNLLLTPGRSVLFTDPRYRIQSAQETTCEVRIVKGPLAAALTAAIGKLALRRVGYEPAR